MKSLHTRPWPVTYLIVAAFLITVSLVVDQVGAALWDWSPRPVLRLVVGRLLITAPLFTVCIYLLGRRTDPLSQG
jgi:hypothetical protein